MSQTKKRRLKKEVLITLVIFGLIVLGAAGILIFKAFDKFDYQKSLDETVISMSNNTVSGCEVNITLRTLGYYIEAVESDHQKNALTYNSQNPLEYWNLYFNKDMSSDSGYVTDIAKRTVITYCIRDNIYYTEARLNGFTLDDEKIEELKSDAELKYTHLSLRAREATGLTAEEYAAIYVKEQTAHEYILYLASTEEGNQLEAVTLKYDVGGYYYNELLEKYDYKINDKIWDFVKLGHITVN